MQRMGRIAQVSVSNGGVPKRAVPEAVVTPAGLIGDRQRNLQVHGGPERAVCLYAREALEALAAEGHALSPGAAGENVTVEGIDWAAVGPNGRFKLGAEVLVEVTRYAAPCNTLVDLFKEGAFARISQKLHPGQSRVYARVLRAGPIRPGDPVEWIGLPRETQRLTFRWWRPDDDALAFRLWADPRVTRLISKEPPDAMAVMERHERELAMATERGFQYWLVFEREGRAAVGCCGLKLCDAAPRSLEMGFHLLAEQWGRGYATEAGRAVIAHAFDSLGVESLFAGHHPENAASKRTLEKLGFQRVGETLFPPTGLIHPWYRLPRPG